MTAHEHAKVWRLVSDASEKYAMRLQDDGNGDAAIPMLTLSLFAEYVSLAYQEVGNDI